MLYFCLIKDESNFIQINYKHHIPHIFDIFSLVQIKDTSGIEKFYVQICFYFSLKAKYQSNILTTLYKPLLTRTQYNNSRAECKKTNITKNYSGLRCAAVFVVAVIVVVCRICLQITEKDRQERNSSEGSLRYR